MSAIPEDKQERSEIPQEERGKMIFSGGKLKEFYAVLC